MPSTRKLLVVVALVLVVLAVVLGIAARLILGGDAVRIAIEQQASAALGQPVAIQTAAPRIFPKPAIHLTGVSIGAGKQVTIDRASLSTGLRALLSKRIEDGELLIEGSRIDVRWGADPVRPAVAHPAARRHGIVVGLQHRVGDRAQPSRHRAGRSGTNAAARYGFGAHGKRSTGGDAVRRQERDVGSQRDG